MKFPFRRHVAAIATAATTLVGSLTAISPAIAVNFGQKEVDQNKFVAVAAPYGNNAHQLLILEQIAETRPCWREFGSAPVQIDPLLTNFDFTGICGRSTDSNGYSIRMDEQDLGLRYSLRIVRRDGNLMLIGAPNRNRNSPEIEIGRANGVVNDFAKIQLNPGWRFAKRTYDGRTLGHVYLTYDSSLPGVDTGSDTDQAAPPAFRDIVGDVYRKEIEDAVDIGFIAGFYEDNTFRPQVSLTREQLVSMVLEALDNMPEADLDIPAQVRARPYSDVDTNRWSAAKIQFARENNIVSGYQDGSFRPTQPVTRAELMAVMRRAAEYGKSIQNLDTTLWPQQDAFDFADTQNHWAAPVIDQMSSYCGVASPLNEVGRSFKPDESAKRNYAAAATLRMLNCVKSDDASDELS
ncbi:MAG: DUF3747 domain-containing protein [Elainellaceae cyanobacterium]